MKKYFRLGFAAVALALVFNAFAVNETKAQGAIDQILKKMDEHYKSLVSLRADVKMVKYDATLQVTEKSDIYEGTTMYLPAKGRDAFVRIDWAAPAQEILSVVNGKYVIFRPRLNQAIIGETKKGAKGSVKANGALAFMNMSRAQLKANYSIRYLGQENVAGSIPTWHLELTPKTPQSYKLADLWVDGNGMPIQAKVTETNNDTTTVLLTNLKKNVGINAGDFAVNLPKGVKIVN
jgi:outer membrane lipoprotein-sorting protein